MTYMTKTAPLLGAILHALWEMDDGPQKPARKRALEALRSALIGHDEVLTSWWEREVQYAAGGDDEVAEYLRGVFDGEGTPLPEFEGLEAERGEAFATGQNISLSGLGFDHKKVLAIPPYTVTAFWDDGDTSFRVEFEDEYGNFVGSGVVRSEDFNEGKLLGLVKEGE